MSKKLPKLPKPPEPPELPPRLLKADPMNFPTSPDKILDKPEKKPSPPLDDDDGRFVVYRVVGRVNDDPPKVVSSP